MRAGYLQECISAGRRACRTFAEGTDARREGVLDDGQLQTGGTSGHQALYWWNEALHGVARAGLATVFPQPIGMAASFSPETVYEVFTAVSDEARAKNAYYTSQESHERYQGLTMWTPTVNIYRDPRWGRGIETYGGRPLSDQPYGSDGCKGVAGYERWKI